MSTEQAFVPTCPVADPVSTEVERTGWKVCGEPPVVEFPSIQDVKFAHSTQRASRLCDRHAEEKVSVTPLPKQGRKN